MDENLDPINKQESYTIKNVMENRKVWGDGHCGPRRIFNGRLFPAGLRFLLDCLPIIVGEGNSMADFFTKGAIPFRNPVR